VFRTLDLRKTYVVGEVRIEALRGIDLEFYRGEFAVLLGASGSGKSTLLNILGGLDTPTAGSVHYLDHELGHASDAELTRFRREHVALQDGRLVQQPVRIGERGDLHAQVLDGLAEGDRVVTYPDDSLQPGERAKVVQEGE
jgi:predicted ABC-type transport system involved in lysophospholipase L1 biosynthesis ATPase subunit